MTWCICATLSQYCLSQAKLQLHTTRRWYAFPGYSSSSCLASCIWVSFLVCLLCTVSEKKRQKIITWSISTHPDAGTVDWPIAWLLSLTCLNLYTCLLPTLDLMMGSPGALTLPTFCHIFYFPACCFLLYVCSLGLCPVSGVCDLLFRQWTRVFAQMIIARRTLRDTIWTSSTWRTPGRVVPYLPGRAAVKGL